MISQIVYPNKTVECKYDSDANVSKLTMINKESGRQKSLSWSSSSGIILSDHLGEYKTEMKNKKMKASRSTPWAFLTFEDIGDGVFESGYDNLVVKRHEIRGKSNVFGKPRKIEVFTKDMLTNKKFFKNKIHYIYNTEGEIVSILLD